MAFIFGKGMLKVRRIRDSDDFLVAGRNVGWLLLFATMGATVIGGGYSVGAVGKTYEWGVLMLIVSTGGYLHFIFSGLVVAPKFREANLYTVAGYFGYRFGEGPRFVILVLSLLFSVFIIAAQMAAFGTVLSAILPSFTEAQIDLRWAILIGGLLVVIYSTAGGLLAVIYTDIYQFIILFAGFLLTLAFALPDMLPRWSEITARVPADFFRFEGGKGIAFLVTTFLAFLLGETFAPGYATRYCIGRDVQHTRWGIAGVGFFLALTFPAILFFIALYGRVHFPNIEPQQALPFVIQSLHNPWVAGLMIAALLSAVMSSADSALNSSTAIFVKDLFEHQLGWSHKGDRYLLRLARICSAILGVVAIVIAILWSDIIELLLFTYHVWAPAVIVPVTVGALTKDRSRAMLVSVFASMIVATVVTTVYRVTPYAENFDPAVFGVGVSALTYFALRLYFRISPPRSSESPHRG
ncbi:sodium:solute symporter family protein [bacterium]|nr:sodium:solute symporter family protein [bacterium]MBU1983100.1 sodium:solute symporter family protein [bacterium]